MDGARRASGRASRTAAASGAIAAIVAVAAVACAATTGVELRDGRWRDRDGGWAIEAPTGSWKRAEAEGADLAFVAPDGASMSVGSRCEGAFAPPAILARHLWLGLGGVGAVQGADAVVAGAPAYAQVFDVTRDGARLRIKTVTRVAGRCVQDFVLVAPGGAFAPAEATFDAWWASFAPGEAVP